MDLTRGSRIVLADCLGAKEGESFLVVTDEEKRPIGEALYAAGRELGLKAHLLVMPFTGTSGAEPTALVAEAMKMADIVVCPTKHSLTHTAARKEACAAGARVATLPGITEEMFSQGALTADYKEVAALSDRVTEILNQGRNVRLESGGRVLELSLEGRKGISSNGLYHAKGSSGNLPTGEAYIAPLEGTANGKILVDGSLAELGVLKGPLEITIKDGFAVGFEGPDAAWLEEKLSVRPEARSVAELGIGTNAKARIIGNMLEDEKVYGTVHVAFGSNATFGGKVSAGLHIDAVILNPVLIVDGKVIVRDRKVLI